jgi:subtilisin-like proprotein convertase family protein
MKRSKRITVAVVVLLIVATIAGDADARRRRRRRRPPPPPVVTPTPTPTPDATPRTFRFDGRGMPLFDQSAEGYHSSSIDLESAVRQRVVDVDVELHGLTYRRLSWLDIGLVGPSGDLVLLVSDCSSDAVPANLELALDDEAARAVPFEGEVGSGTYRPTNLEGEEDFGRPGFSDSLSDFDGTDPVGRWTLRVRDDTIADGEQRGVLEGWTLVLTVI